VQIGCGSFHSLAVTADGRVYQWGKLQRLNDDKQYFGGVVEMPGMSDWARRLIDKSHQQYYSGKKTQIDNENNQLGNFGTFTSYLQNIPLLVESLIHERIVKVAAGYSFTLAVTEEGRVYGWGYNDKMQLGVGHRLNQEEPQLIKLLGHERVVDVACGQQHSLALTEQGQVYSWGLGVFGQLGHGVLSDEGVPLIIKEIESRKIIKISCGSHHSLILEENGQVWSFGSSEYGQQGGSKTSDWRTNERVKDHNYFYSVPRPLEEDFEGRKVVKIACGNLHNIAISESGEIFTWGWGMQGVLGHGNRKFQVAPTLISRLRGEPILEAAASGNHTIAITASSSSSFAFDFKWLVNNPQYSDLKYRVGGKTIFAHRVLVYNRCQHLKQIALMLYRFAGQKYDEEVELKNIDHNVFLGLLYYLYTDHLKVAPHLVPKLQDLASSYRLPRLVALCKRFARLGRIENDGTSVAIPASLFAEQMTEAINSKQYSDVTFTVKESADSNTIITVYGHKCVLVSRSDYFKTILDPNSAFAERGRNSFPLDEIHRDTFVHLMQYLYSNCLPELTADNVIELLMGADRFLIEDMKQLIATEIEDSIMPDNVVDLLLLSERTLTPRLRRACINLIFNSCKQHRHQPDQLSFLRASPHNVLREIDFMCSKRLGTPAGEMLKLISAV
jgi:alpha-tubulin suppressor-like RCC1 family protein